MPTLDCISGESTLIDGSTNCRIGMIRDDGAFIIRELQNSFKGVSDRVKGSYDASLQGVNSSRLLGTWTARTITAPDGAFIFIGYSLKSKFMTTKTSLNFALRISEASPLMEIKLPIVTNKHSSLTSLSIVGRFDIANSEELSALLKVTNNSLQLRETIGFHETLEAGGALDELWTYLASSENNEGDTLFLINGASVREVYKVEAKFMASADRTTKKKVAAKAKAKKTGKSTGGVTFAARKRRLKLL